MSKLGVLTGIKLKRVRFAQDEGVIERYLVKCCDELHVPCIKLKGPNGWPDRTVLWPNGEADFIETKRPKRGRYQPLQQRTHARLRKLGYRVLVLNTQELVASYIRERQLYFEMIRRRGKEPQP